MNFIDGYSEQFHYLKIQNSIPKFNPENVKVLKFIPQQFFNSKIDMKRLLSCASFVEILFADNSTEWLKGSKIKITKFCNYYGHNRLEV